VRLQFNPLKIPYMAIISLAILYHDIQEKKEKKEKKSGLHSFISEDTLNAALSGNRSILQRNTYLTLSSDLNRIIKAI
jgi:hypothetical protein